MKSTEWNPSFDRLSPAFEPFRPLIKRVRNMDKWPACRDLNTLKQQTRNTVATHSGKPVRFVPEENAGSKDSAQPYEYRIYQTGAISTRPKNWHDFFNALVWLTFPQAKAALNHIHYHAQVRALRYNIRKRGPLRDAATLFDESGVIVLSSQAELIKLLRQHEWKKLFWCQRYAVLASMRFIVFGHALYEKALHPYIGMTGKGVFFNVEEAFLQQPLLAQLQALDQWLTDFLLQKLSSTADLSPIPILGYPGWLDANVSSEFYDNRDYFRPLAL